MHESMTKKKREVRRGKSSYNFPLVRNIKGVPGGLTFQQDAENEPKRMRELLTLQVMSA